MANISALDDSRRNGSPVKGGPVVKSIHTNNLVVALEPELRQISDTHWTCDSFTQTLVTYHLELNEYGNWMCSCPRYAFHFECKHVRKLIKELDRIEGDKYMNALRSLETQLPKPAKTLTLEMLYE